MVARFYKKADLTEKLDKPLGDAGNGKGNKGKCVGNEKVENCLLNGVKRSKHVSFFQISKKNYQISLLKILRSPGSRYFLISSR